MGPTATTLGPQQMSLEAKKSLDFLWVRRIKHSRGEKGKASKKKWTKIKHYLKILSWS